MTFRTLRENFWGWFGALCFVALVILSFWPGIPDQGIARKKLVGFLVLGGAIAAGCIIADRLGLIPRSVPRKCPKCGKRLKSFTKDYSTGEITCKRCGETFMVRKGRTAKDRDQPS